jgi:assimilatory nitrate reductase catalytic subunit
MADLVLPAAGWGEKDGTLINSERRFGIVKKVARAPGHALSDFAIFKLVAEAWGCGEMFRSWQTPEAVFQIMNELSRGQPCDFSGVRDYAHIDAANGIQWPYTERDALLMENEECRMMNSDGIAALASANHSTFTILPSPLGANAPQQRRLFANGKFFTSDQKAKFLFAEPRAMPELTDAQFPFLLMTGRGSSAQWHTGTRTNKSAVLRKLAPRELHVEINPSDAMHLAIADGEKIYVRSRRGRATAIALVTTIVQPGQIFMPMHFEIVNTLTFPAFDPHSRQPSYKACAVTLERIATN